MLKNFANLVREETANVLRSPRRLRHVFNPRKWGYVKHKLSVSDEWESEDRQGFSGRKYDSYRQYVEHQKSKLETVNLGDYDTRYRNILRERLDEVGKLQRGNAVLCLAARLGTEVKGFIDLGCFAVGTDLNPGTDNHYVVHGDFHDLQYADDSVDVVFTNSLDHAHQIDKVADQIVRVLKPGGHFVIDLVAASDRGKDPGFWASCWWEKPEDIIGVFEERGLTVTHRAEIDKPWAGEHIWMQKAAAGA